MSGVQVSEAKTTLLERVIAAHQARSMHHHIVLDALNLIEGPDAARWKSVFLLHHPDLLKGAKAPDAEFKDFQNHVLHVSEGNWGGAQDAAMDWYGEFVEMLRAKKFAKAAYALGVLSHYYADPCQPFHTGQTEEEGAVHRAVEWSIFKSADRIKARIAGLGYPKIEAGEGPGFVADMVLAGARKSHPHYETFIDHYDLEAGLEDPASGIDEIMFDAVAELVAYATAGVAVLISRGVAEAGVAAPKCSLTMQGYLAGMGVPVRKIVNKLSDAADKRAVEDMYAELQKTGKVINALPEDDRFIRKLHARTVLRTPLKELDKQPIGPLGSKVEGKAKPEPKVETEAEEIVELKEAVPAKPSRAEMKAAKAAEKEAARAAKEEAKRKEAEAREAEKAAKRKAEEEAKAQAAAAKESERQAAAEAKAKAEAKKEAARKAEADAKAKAQADKDAAKKAEAEAKAKIEAEKARAAEATAEQEKAEARKAPVAPPKPASLEASEEDEASGGHGDTRGLNRESPVVDAPSIGRKTAKRLNRAGIHTVGDLLDCEPEEVSDLLEVRYITAEKVIEWQDQTRLMIAVPGLRVIDAQILVGAGVRTVEDLANASARDLFMDAMTFLTLPEGEDTLNSIEDLDEDEVQSWIGLAQKAA